MFLWRNKKKNIIVPLLPATMLAMVFYLWEMRTSLVIKHSKKKFCIKLLLTVIIKLKLRVQLLKASLNELVSGQNVNCSSKYNI